MIRARKKLGEMLLESGALTKEELDHGLKEQRRGGKKLGATLIECGYITEDDLLKVLSGQMGIPYIKVENTPIQKEAILLLDKSVALEFNVLPIEIDGDTLKVAMDDPLNIFAIDAIEKSTGYEINQVLTNSGDIKIGIEKYYSPVFLKGEKVKYQNQDDEYSTVEIVDLILKKAIGEKASDIHIEVEQDEVRVRFRIDGVLHEMMKYKKGIYSSLISRLKVIAKLDITEKRVPQDGRIEIEILGKSLDVRVSTLPTIFGEKIVMRLLDKENVKVDLGKLGFNEKDLKSIYHLIKRPNGIFFVTGPTGSGKTSTLYAAISEINNMEKNIITLEDPVEYQLEIINQVQVNPNVGLTFASGLRSVLRQDPDVIMIGEIRDLETAEISIESAMTGHLVLSTLHTNSAVGTISRLIDMGVKPYLIAATLNGVLGQRLVRRLCNHCKEEKILSSSDLLELGVKSDESKVVYEATGCSHCRNTGYQGRFAITEILTIDRELRVDIKENFDLQGFKAKAVKKGFETLKEKGMKKVFQGETSISEILRVAEEEL